EIAGRGCLKALYYKDILIIIICYLVTGRAVLVIAIKFIYYRKANNKLRPTIFFFILIKRFMFYTVSTIITLALYN
ncbi:FluG domain-containing protein, partial [Colletotrichum lupini]